MCWSPTVTAVMVGAGTIATIATARRGNPPAIWGTIAFFTAMEALQLVGYSVIDDCQAPANRPVTFLSYLHIALQPIAINLFAMAMIGPSITPRVRRIALSLSTLAAVILMVRLIPGTGPACAQGQVLCGVDYCTISGDWHLGWTVPWYNVWGFLPTADTYPGLTGFLEYMLAGFLLPALYGAWRFSLFHLIFGPILAWSLTTNPNEMPAIWCLFSISILFVALSPQLGRFLFPTRVMPQA